MRKRLLKTALLAAAMVMGTTGAWAQDYTTVYERGVAEGYTTWTEADLADYTTSGNTALAIHADRGLGQDYNQTGSITKSFDITAQNALIKYEVDWLFSSSTGRATNYDYIQFGDALRLSWGYNYKLYLNENGSSSSDVELWSGGNTSYTKRITLVINTATRGVETFTFADVNGTNAIDLTSYMTSTTLPEGNYNSIMLGFIRAGSVNWTCYNYLTNITVSQAEQTVQTATYTISYTLNGQEVLSTQGESAAGGDVTPESVITVDGTKYLSVSDPQTVTLVAGDNGTIEVPVRLPYTATLRVTKVVTGVSYVEETPLVETDDKSTAWGYYYSLYVEQDGTYYQVDKADAPYGETGTFTDGQVIERTVNYSTVDPNVVYFGELEKMSTTSLNTGNANYSNGGYAAVPARRSLTLATLPAGDYTYVVNVVASMNRAANLHDVNADMAAIIAEVSNGVGSALGVNTVNFTLDAETTLSVSGYNTTASDGSPTYNQSADIDYIIIRKAAPTAIDVTIGSTGYATFSSEYDVNFSGVEGLTAYVATVDDDQANVTLAEVTSMQRGNGVILAGAPGNYSVPVAASVEPVPDNDLIATTEGQTIQSDATTTYYGLKDVNGTAVFAKIADAGITAPAGKAYIAISTQAAEAKGVVLTIGGETTGISSVVAEGAKANGIYFNLSGQRVVKPSKGLYILNGKKVVVK